IDAAIQSNLRETTTRVLASLTPREERVLRMRFGIGMNTDHTLEEVDQQFSVTRERIRQIEAKALRKLKHQSRRRELRSVMDNSCPRAVARASWAILARGIHRLIRLIPNAAGPLRLKKFRPAEPGETIFDIEARRLAAPPAANERLQLSVGLRIGIGVCHRPPARTPRGVDVVAPDLAVTV